MTISSKLLLILNEKCYNILGDMMSNIDKIISFENEKMKLIIDKLKEYNFNDLINLIYINHQMIINENTLIVNEMFSFETHLNILFNYIIEYPRNIKIQNQEFYDLVYNDFCEYWKNIICPKLVIS